MNMIAYKISNTKLPALNDLGCELLYLVGNNGVYGYYKTEDIKKLRQEVHEEMMLYEEIFKNTCNYCGTVKIEPNPKCKNCGATK